MKTKYKESYLRDKETGVMKYTKPPKRALALEFLGMCLRLCFWIALFVGLFLTARWKHMNTFPPIIETAHALEFEEPTEFQLAFNTMKISKAIDKLDLPDFPEERPYQKLAIAVGKHETAGCTKGWGALYNNCVGKRVYNGVELVPARFATKEDSYRDFEEFWGRMYGNTVPTWENAVTYSGDDRAKEWFNNVTYFLNTL